MKEWFTPSETAEAGLPDLPNTVRGINAAAARDGWQGRRNVAGARLARRRKGRGGGWEYHYSVYPIRAQQMLVAADMAAKKKAVRGTLDERRSGGDWEWFDALPESRKAKARNRLDILGTVIDGQRGGIQKNLAVCEVARQAGIGSSTIYAWFDLVAGRDGADWLPALAPRHCGRNSTVACDPEAWEILKADYLRPERPTFESCHRRLLRVADEKDWTLPSLRTLQRRMESEVPAAVQILARRGPEALKRMYPAQERDRSVFTAMEAVNADGHRWDVWVKWPDGEVGRPVMVAIQDLLSGMIVSWRIDKTENKEAVRLALGDMVETYGIPDHIWLDNGRNFASKWLTGGTPTRYRFKVKAEEPAGILTSLGVEVHWTTPYAGQSKPIERAFRDFCDNIAKHPAFAGAWTGNSPVNKPENYGSHAVPLDDFIRVVGEEIREHNARQGRRTRVCNGQSFQQVFEASYAAAPIKKATDEQRRLWLLAAEGIRASRTDGALRLLNNRYWANFLHNHLGQPLIARFDPAALHEGIHVYRLDGGYLGFAECIEATGFADVSAAREHSRARQSWMRAQKDMLTAARKMTAADVADQLPQSPDLLPMEAKVVRLAATVSVGALRQEPKAAPLDAHTAEVHDRLVMDFSERREASQQPETSEDRYARAADLEADIAAGRPVEANAKRWMEGYRGTIEYRTQSRMAADIRRFEEAQARRA